MALSTSAIIVIVIVACLAVVSLGAALTRQFHPAEQPLQQFSREQELYMRSVRMKNMGFYRRESGTPLPKDVESAYTADDSSRY